MIYKIVFYSFLLIVTISKTFQQSHTSFPLIRTWHDSQHLDQWYSILDHCILRNSSSISSDTVVNDCIEATKNKMSAKQPLRCQIGNSWPTKSGFCANEDIPFANRISLRQSLDGYDDPSQKPLLKLFTNLKDENGALLLIGDSVMQQFYAGLACELEREGIWKDPDQYSNTDETKFVFDKVAIKFLPIYHFVNGRFDRIANASMFNLKKNVEEFTTKYDSVLIVVNMGLHYVSNPITHFSRLDYQSQMTLALQYLYNIASSLKHKKIRILWRETSAQHFPTSNGYWPGQKYSHDMQLKCIPINHTSPTSDWRNNDIDAIIRANKFEDKIHIIPFYEMTIPLYELHVNGKMRDCTHFCWTPMLYQYLFHALANATELFP